MWMFCDGNLLAKSWWMHGELWTENGSFSMAKNMPPF
jgi:hypothetical protein